ncbi:hypothetical protein [Halorussus lipolyticus]|uniref:hypothetical protein n=1 Tax=Halorussus lipolyticus TaxID=3034024 RepID=UPI0023E8BC79|nr:hypothetical protein [Halorussus sp. DT80]
MHPVPLRFDLAVEDIIDVVLADRFVLVTGVRLGIPERVVWINFGCGVLGVGEPPDDGVCADGAAFNSALFVERDQFLAGGFRTTVEEFAEFFCGGDGVSVWRMASRTSSREIVSTYWPWSFRSRS